MRSRWPQRRSPQVIDVIARRSPYERGRWPAIIRARTAASISGFFQALADGDEERLHTERFVQDAREIIGVDVGSQLPGDENDGHVAHRLVGVEAPLHP